MQIISYPSHYQSVCANFDFSSFSRISCITICMQLPSNLHAFTPRFACFCDAIQLQLPDNLVAIASQFAAIAQITCVTKARNDVFMLVHAGVDGRTPNGGFLVGKRFFDVFNAFG